jgi:hypothetical protein
MLRQAFWWDGMLSDCREAAGAAIPRQLEQARYQSPKHLFPTGKGLMPFACWAIDTITNQSPPAPDGSTSIIVSVDATTKWVEIGTIPVLDSHHTTQWVHDHIICRFGVPDVIRSD